MPDPLEVKTGGSRQGQLHEAPGGGRHLPDRTELGASRSLQGHKPGEGTGKAVEEAAVMNATTYTLIAYLSQSSLQPTRG